MSVLMPVAVIIIYTPISLLEVMVQVQIRIIDRRWSYQALTFAKVFRKEDPCNPCFCREQTLPI